MSALTLFDKLNNWNKIANATMHTCSNCGRTGTKNIIARRHNKYGRKYIYICRYGCLANRCL